MRKTERVVYDYDANGMPPAEVLGCLFHCLTADPTTPSKVEGQESHVCAIAEGLMSGHVEWVAFHDKALLSGNVSRVRLHLFGDTLGDPNIYYLFSVSGEGESVRALLQVENTKEGKDGYAKYRETRYETAAEWVIECEDANELFGLED